MSLITGGSANLVPCLTNANTSQTVFGSGGGGGPIGPNPVVSSITFAPNIAGPNVYTQGVLNMSTQLVIQDPGTLVVQDYFFQTGLPTPVDFTSSFVSTTNSFVINGPGGDGNNGGMNLVGSADGRSMITALTAINVVSSLAIVADPVIIPFNLQVSSINGQAPGGGGSGPNLVISTLTVNDTGNITLDWNNGGGTLNFGFEATNTSSFILQQGIGVSGTKVAGPEGCIQVLEKDGGANQVFAPLQASGFEVCATAYPGGAFAGLYFSSIGSVLYSAVGQPLTIDAPAGVSVSSLTVSSINGGVPALTSLFSTLFAANPSLSTIVY